MAYNDESGVDPQIQIESQARQILVLRAALAESQKRVAQKETYILRLERRAAADRQSVRQKAEARFGG